ncbi:hypothetical protein [uncultured Sphaerochaeta sp.]|uniref:hypothetical protein n=1 Tax=uncultured Sphaerochaeta sp. TaxID=886478 RepID=UPI0029CA5A11|nr:hypothetical protein [uncultured Sphaerochaeta sp.]
MSYLSKLRKIRYLRSIKDDPDYQEKSRFFSFNEAYDFDRKVYLWRQWAIKKKRGRLFKEFYCFVDYLRMIRYEAKSPRIRKVCGNFREHRKLIMSHLEKYCPKDIKNED